MGITPKYSMGMMNFTSLDEGFNTFMKEMSVNDC